MFDVGLVEEVTNLRAQYGKFSKTALQGVGYREVLQVLDGELNLEEAVEQTKIRTRRFARRQETWFRGLEECQWIGVDELADQDVVDRLLSIGSSG